MPLELTKKQLFETIQVLYPGIGPNKDYQKFKKASYEAFYLQLGISKENITDPTAVEFIFNFVEIFVKNFKRLWNQRKNKSHFSNMVKNNAVFFNKVWSFEEILNPPPPPVKPVAESVDLGPVPWDVNTVQENERKKPFRCSECAKSFRFQSHVKEHFESVHEGKRHKCSLCDSNFSREGTLKRHISTLHKDNTSYNCSKCEATFFAESELEYHIASVHEGRKTERKYKIQNESAHEKKNQKNRSAFRCEVCNLNVVPKEMINHLKTAHKKEKQYRMASESEESELEESKFEGSESEGSESEEQITLD